MGYESLPAQFKKIIQDLILPQQLVEAPVGGAPTQVDCLEQIKILVHQLPADGCRGVEMYMVCGP